MRMHCPVCKSGTPVASTATKDHKIEDIELHHPPYAVYLCQMLAEGGGLQGREVDDTDVRGPRLLCTALAEPLGRETGVLEHHEQPRTLQLAGECHFLLTGDLQVGSLSQDSEPSSLTDEGAYSRPPPALAKVMS